MKGDKNKEVKDDSMKDLVSEKLRSTKKAIADFLNERVNRLSVSHKRLSLLLFGILMGVICIGQIIQSLREDGKETAITFEQITLPKDIHQDNARNEKLQRVLRIKQLLDSLEQTAAYDSLMIARPGLVDSVNLLVQQYQSGF